VVMAGPIFVAQLRMVQLVTENLNNFLYSKFKELISNSFINSQVQTF
jgi:hypothetical protein